MQKKTKILKKEYGKLVLYLDDLKEIEAALAHPEAQITIHTKDHEFDTIDELVEASSATKSLSYLEFKFCIPYDKDRYPSGLRGSVEIADNIIGSSVTFFDDSDICHAKVNRISDILNKKLRNPAFLFNNYFIIYNFFFYAAVFSLNSFFKTAFPLVLTKTYSVFPLYISVFLYLLSISLMLIHFLTKTIIYLQNKVDRPNFFERNKDQLMTNLVTNTVTALVTYFLASR